MKKKAVILFNLGGPDSLSAVKPFLFNLFNDKAIITVPQPVRYFIARMISGKRAPIAQEIYGQIGGKSPILELTRDQAKALEDKLNHIDQKTQYRVFICMRYWHPMTQEVVQQVKNYVPDEIILLPLYPQFSTTTTGSSFSQWDNCMKNEGLKIPTRKICCYSMQENYVNAHAEQISQALKITDILPRILFSAHGLPEKIIKKGDPYQWQVEQNVAAIVQKLSIPDLDYSVCYQSRVGPLKWIGPSTEEELKKAGEQKKSVMVVPIAFVSEHSETLVELDIEYKHLAQEAGVPEYIRVPALATHSLFIEGLSRLCVDAGHDKPIACHTGGRICPKEFSQCPAQGVR